MEIIPKRFRTLSLLHCTVSLLNVSKGHFTSTDMISHPPRYQSFTSVGLSYSSASASYSSFQVMVFRSKMFTVS